MRNFDGPIRLGVTRVMAACGSAFEKRSSASRFSQTDTVKNSLRPILASRA